MASSFCPQTMTDVVGNPEEERRADYYYQPWSQEAVCRYFYSKVGTRSKLPTYVQVLASTAGWVLNQTSLYMYGSLLLQQGGYSIKAPYICMGPCFYCKVSVQKLILDQTFLTCMGPYFYSKVIPKGCPMQRICYFSKLVLCIAWSLLLHGQLMANLT